MDEITRRDVDMGLNSLRESSDIMDAPIFSDDRLVVLGGFRRTCDSMMSDFESLCDGIDQSLADTESAAANPVRPFPILGLGMSDDPFIVQ